MDFKSKYLKYKTKYLALKKQSGGGCGGDHDDKKKSKQCGGSKEKDEVLLFKAEWCGHCKKFKPVWNELKEMYKNKYVFNTYDSDEDKDKMKQWGVSGFPTIIFKRGDDAIEYSGDRSIGSIVKFLEAQE